MGLDCGSGAEHLGLLSGRRPADGWPLTRLSGFSIDDFAIDTMTGIVTYPNGIKTRISASAWATFGVICRGCPLGHRCTTAINGRSVKVRTTTTCSPLPEPTPSQPNFNSLFGVTVIERCVMTSFIVE